MQIPANAAAPGSPQTVSSGASAGVSGLLGAVTQGKGKLPAFAAVLAEQSVQTEPVPGAGIPRDAGGKKDADEAPATPDEKNVDALPLPGKSPHAELNPAMILLSQEAKGIAGKQSTHAVPAKGESKAIRHRTGEVESKESKGSAAPGDKKQIGASDQVPTAAIPPLPEVEPPAPTVALVQWSPAPHLLPAPEMPVAPQHAFAAPGSMQATMQSPIQNPVHNHMEDRQAPMPGEEVSAQSLPSWSDSAKSDLSIDFVSADTGREAASRESRDKSDPNGSLSPEAATSATQPMQLRQPQESSDDFSLPGMPQADLAEVKVSSLPGAAAHAIVSGPSPVAAKSKAQEKTGSEFVHGMTAAVTSTASTGPRLPGGDAATTASPVRMTEPADAAMRQRASVPDANAFQRLDGGESPATLLHSSAHQISVGVHDPSLGWLEVQTQSSAGRISATLTAASGEAHASLSAQAPAITQYLADRDVSVRSLHVYTQADAQGNASGGGQTHSEAGQQAYRQMPEGKEEVMAKRMPSPLYETDDASVVPAGGALRINVRA